MIDIYDIFSLVDLQIELNHVKNEPIPPGWGADRTGWVRIYQHLTKRKFILLFTFSYYKCSECVCVGDS